MTSVATWMSRHRKTASVCGRSKGHEDFALQLLEQGPEVAYAAKRPLTSLARVTWGWLSGKMAGWGE